MNMRCALAVSAGLLLLVSSKGWSQVRPLQPPLPNFDGRQAATNSGSTSSVPASFVSAQNALATRVPNIIVSRDRVLGSPRYVAASRGFLSGVEGAGRSVSSSFAQALPAADPHRSVEAFVNQYADLFGFNADQLAASTIKRDYVTAQDGLRTTIWQQKFEGIEVYDGVFIGHATHEGQLVSISSLFLADPASAAHLGQAGREFEVVTNPPITAPAAISLAAANLGGTVPGAGLVAAATASGAEQHQSFTGAGLRGNADVRLVWLPLNGSSMRLAWWVVLSSRARPEYYSVVVDAETGKVMVRRCLTDYATSFTYNVFPSDSPSPFSPGLQTPGNTQPAVTNRTLVTLTALDTNASPSGWITTGQETTGNNVDAHLDRNDDDVPDLPRPVATGSNVFDFPLDLTSSPLSYGNGSVVNLFYWNNFMHDKLYELGFTEAAGNFQNDNFGRGGQGNDAVQADGQDGASILDFFHVDNANFSTLPDGIPGRMQMYLFTGPNPDRDGDLDAEVMCHEYTHGLSGRLLGGGVGIYQLQPAGMGEGWSDFYALSLLSEEGDDPHAAYAMGGYVTYLYGGTSFDQNYYFGIRRYPYSTDMSKNPLTLKDIDPTKADSHVGVPISPILGGGRADEVHNMGEVWCVTLWEARANIIDKLGFSAGNKLMLQLVTDGLRLAPPNATFLEARDAILQADDVLTGGDDQVELWTAFAKRGMGYRASVPTADSTIGVVESYEVPQDVYPGPLDGILEVRVTPPSGSVLLGGTNTPIFVRVTDHDSITNATIEATVVGAPSITFSNDGQPPDITANNGVYSANLAPPATNASVTMTLVISAPDKNTSTNVVMYAVVPPPPNDNFADAIKVPPGGAKYTSNNRFATTEPDEPAHAGVSSAAASLWWNYSSPSNTVLLIDTAESSFDSIVAVYTNRTLATLKPVVAVDDVGTRRQAFVLLNVKAGTTYRIAIASHDSESTGSLFANFQPNGIPDTNAPLLTVTTPPSGISVTTNQVIFTGQAKDPDPDPSGVQDIRFRVNPGISALTAKSLLSSTVDLQLDSLQSTNWSQTVALNEGLNDVAVTAVDRAGNLSTTKHILINYLPQDPPNDYFVMASSLTSTPELVTGNNTKATKELGEPNHAGNAGGKSIWWSFQAPGDGVLTLDTTNSTFDTLLAVYTGDRVNALTPLTYNDDAFAGAPGGYSQLSQAVRSGQTYRIAVDGYDGDSGAVFLHYSFVPGTVYHVSVSNTVGGIVVPASADVAAGYSATFNAFPDRRHTFSSWSGGVVSVDNPLTVLVESNMTITANFRPIPIADDFESGSLTNLAWSTGGQAPWIVTNAFASTNASSTDVSSQGRFVARSGLMTDNHVGYQTSSLILTGNFRAGTGSFDYRVSSEPNFDVFGFYVDGVLQRTPPWSGEAGWANFQFLLTSGTHTLEWRYTKDASGTVGLDAAFIDNAILPFAVEPDGTQPQLLVRRQTDGGVYIELSGQPDQQYILQASSDLVDWKNIATDVAIGGVVYFSDPNQTNNPVRFYRAVLAP